MQKPKKRKNKIKKILELLVIIIATIILIILIGLIIIYFKYKEDFKDLQQSAYESVHNMNVDDFNEGVNTYFYYNDGSLMGAYINGSYEYVSLNDVSELIIKGYVAVEDKNFYEHKGIDVSGILRAGAAFVKNRGKITQGGSTITQQVVKNTVIKDSSKTFTRKITEIIASLELEKTYTKEQILEMYLNSNFYGSNCYGIQAACKYYFGHDISEVTASEAAMLVGMSNAPTRYNPETNYETAISKRNQVLDIFLTNNIISENEYNKAISDTLPLVLFREESDMPKTYEFTYTLKCAVEEIMTQEHFNFKYLFNTTTEEQEYIKAYNAAYTKIKKEILTGGYKVYTSIDKNKQSELQKVIDSTMLNYGNERSEDGRYILQAAAVCINNSTNYVEAIIGGREGDEYYNRAYQSARQPGSSIKPVLDYTPAFDTLDYYPSKRLSDTPLSGNYRPKNYDNIYRGNISIRQALLNSTNTTAVKTLMDLGISNCLNYLEKLKFTTISPEDNNNAAIAIGGFTNGVTVEDMTKAYNTIVDNGKSSDRTCIVKMLHQGVVLRDEHTEILTEVYLSGSAYMMTDCLVGNFTEGFVKNYQLDNQICAGKTGSTNDNKDVWLCAYTPYYTTSIWTGYDKPQTFDKGAVACGTIWKEFNMYIHKDLAKKEFTKPKTVYEHNIDWKGDQCDYSSGKKDYFQIPDISYDEASREYISAFDALNKIENKDIQTYDEAVSAEAELEMIKENSIDKISDILEKNALEYKYKNIYGKVISKVDWYKPVKEIQTKTQPVIENETEKETVTEPFTQLATQPFTQSTRSETAANPTQTETKRTEQATKIQATVENTQVTSKAQN